MTRIEEMFEENKEILESISCLHQNAKDKLNEARKQEIQYHFVIEEISRLNESQNILAVEAYHLLHAENPLSYEEKHKFFRLFNEGIISSI